jgi:hypothetical protein
MPAKAFIAAIAALGFAELLSESVQRQTTDLERIPLLFTYRPHRIDS